MIDFELTTADEKILDSAHQQALIGRRYARYYDKHENELTPEEFPEAKDLPNPTRLAEAQRRQVSDAFERYIAAVYAERFDSYAGERLQVTGEQPSAGGTIITSQIVKSNGEPVNINYLVRQNGGGWQIADVYLNGTISELATRRSEFASILRTRGINGLIAMLNTKADALSARAS